MPYLRASISNSSCSVNLRRANLITGFFFLIGGNVFWNTADMALNYENENLNSTLLRFCFFILFASSLRYSLLKSSTFMSLYFSVTYLSSRLRARDGLRKRLISTIFCFHSIFLRSWHSLRIDYNLNSLRCHLLLRHSEPEVRHWPLSLLRYQITSSFRACQ